MRIGLLLFIIIVVLVGTAVFSPSARAELVTIAIEGVVDHVDDSLGLLNGEITPGDPITGRYTYNTSTPDSNPSPRFGTYRYPAPYGILLSIGDFSFQSNELAPDYLIEITNDYPPNDTYFLKSRSNDPLPDGSPVDVITWHLLDRGGTAVSSTQLGTLAPSLDDWGFNRLHIVGDRTFDIDGHITRATAVPEPCTVALLGLGTFCLRKRR